jgi:pyruvate kinase
LAILADLPGPKIRLGQISPDPVEIKPGSAFTLTTEDIVGDASRASMTFAHLPQAVKPGDTLLVSDGLLQLEVVDIRGQVVNCRVVVGGELRSRKGLNLPNIQLGIRPSRNDRRCLEFALAQVGAVVILCGIGNIEACGSH